MSARPAAFLLRHALPAFLVSLAPAAQAAVINVNTDSTTPVSLSGADILNVLAGVSLTVSSNTQTVAWTGSSGAGPTVNNEGAIQNTYNTGTASNRALNMSFNSASSSFTLNNGSIGNTAASITAVGDVFRINRAIGAGTVTVTNYGTMASSGNNGDINGQVLDFNANTSTTGTVTIHNHGSMTAANADALRPGNRATLHNHGVIRGNSTGDGGNDGIDFQDPGKSGTVNNYATGSIVGARHGITAKEAITLDNAGTIEGLAGGGVNIDSSSGIMLITNSGLIRGNAVGGVDGDGIDVDYLADIRNSGVITALGLGGGGNLNEAVAIGGGAIQNYAGGVIHGSQRAITIDDSNLGGAFAAVTIYNEGHISGDLGEAILVAGAFANALDNKGRIDGGVVLGSGLDSINLFTGSLLNGVLDGGGGVDTLRLRKEAGATGGALGQVRNVEVVSLEDGDWTLTSLDGYLFESLRLNGGELLLASAGLSVITGEIQGAHLAGGQVTNIRGNGGVIRYDAQLAGNAYLAGGTYDLQDGGVLKPLPEPQTLALLLSGLGLLAGVRGRFLRA